MSIIQETADKLLANGIHVDEFDRVMMLIDTDEADTIEWSGDPVADFKTAIILVNDRRGLPEDLSSWCDRYDVEWNEPELLAPENIREL